VSYFKCDRISKYLNNRSSVADELISFDSVMGTRLNHKQKKSLERACLHRLNERDRFLDVNRFVRVGSDAEVEQRQEAYQREQQLQTPPQEVSQQSPRNQQVVEAPHKRIVRLRTPSPIPPSKRVVKVGQVSAKFVVVDSVGETDDQF
jgi:hypothetical protein